MTYTKISFFIEYAKIYLVKQIHPNSNGKRTNELNTVSITTPELELIRHFSQYRSARGAAALRLYSHFPSLIFNSPFSIEEVSTFKRQAHQ